MRTTLLLLLSAGALLQGCSPPPVRPEPCLRALVDPAGNRAGFMSAAPTSPLAVANTLLSFAVFAPLSGCARDDLIVNASLLDAENQLVPGLTTTPASLNGTSGVSTTVSVLPKRPGQYTLRVAFEPSLGVRNFIIDVATVGLERPTTRVPIPDGSFCSTNRLWPLSDDTVACESLSAGLVTVTSADGGSTTFTGTQLVVVDTVLWSVDNHNETLERRVWEDGGLRLLNSYADFPPAPTPGMHDVELAMRFRSNGRLTRARVVPDGGADFLQYSLSLGGSPLAYFTDDDDLAYRWSYSTCDPGVCVAVLDLVALEPGFVWRSSRFPNDPLMRVRLSAFARPLGEDAGLPRFSLDYPAEQTVTPDSPFERLPLWLKQSVGNLKVMVSVSKDGGLELSAWPRSEVLQVGRHHVVLSDEEPGFVRVIQR